MPCGWLLNLKLLLNFQLSLDDFEAETGQSDGRLAYAIKGWIGIVSFK